MPAGQMEATEPVVLEIERFEWVKPERIELVGVWSGVGARRFIRPTLVLERDGEPVRLLAVLEHKPWQAAEGEEWIAAFTWNGEPVKCDSADMNVAPGIDVKLPPPRMRPGKPRRFKQRAVARDAVREAAAAERAAGPGIVAELPKPAARTASEPKPAAKAAEPKPATKSADPAPAKAVDPKPAAKAAEPKPAETEPTLALSSAASTAAQPKPTQPVDTPVDDSELTRLRFDVERLRGELDRARGDRDQAREELRAARRAIEEERQGRERAIADARAEERASANTSLSEGAELRAAVERQRQMAYEARDEAVKQRDSAVAAREQACAERDEAVRLRKQADHDRSAADSERDRALKEAARARAARDKALAERDDALRERDEASKERDTIVSVHERGLPVVPPKPRFAPPDEGPPTELDIWGPRIAALIILGIFAIIVLHLFSTF